MKTICTRDGDKSIHLFGDECIFKKEDNKIFIKNESGGLILVLSNLSLYKTYENITAPYNWAPGKYRYTETRGWMSCSDWKFPYDNVFEVFRQKHLQLIQCLYDKSFIDNDDLLLLADTTSLQESMIEYKMKYENNMP
jgi:hypothetical protein